MAIPGYKEAKVCYFPRSEKIIHHKKHSYDDKKNVIVVDDADEDRQEFINSFKDTVGLKNIMKQLALQGFDGYCPREYMYDQTNDAVDISGLPDNINDLKAAADEGDKIIHDAVKQFNDLYGTTYTVEEFLKKSSDGSLITEMTEKLKAKEEVKEEGDK